MPASSPGRRCRSTAASTCIDGAADYAPPTKRSVLIAGHPTSISLEPMFWRALEAAARERGCPVNALVAEIDVGAARCDRAAEPDLGDPAVAICAGAGGCSDRRRESRRRVGRMIEEQRRLDQLELHDLQRAVIARDDVDAGIGRTAPAPRRARLGQAQSRRRAARSGSIIPPYSAGRGIRRASARLTTAWLKAPSNSISEYSPLWTISSISGCTIMRQPRTVGRHGRPRAEAIACRRRSPRLAASRPARRTRIGHRASSRSARRSSFDGHRRHGRNARSCKLREIGLVAVPAKQRQAD